MPRSPLQTDVLRVVLTGAESTGKTTLAALLAGHYDTVWLPEYVRAFVEEHGEPTYDDVARIAQGHLDQEAACLPDAHRVLIYDTDLLSTCLYSRYIFGRCPGWVDEAARDRTADLYLLAGDDIPWVPDPGQRENPSTRDTLQPLFKQMLEERNLPYVTVDGSLESRLKTAIAAIDALLLARHA